MLIHREVHAHHERATLPIRSSGTIIHRLVMLAKRECLCTNEFATLLLHTSKSTLAGSDMLFSIHLDVFLREASQSVIQEERAVAPIQNVDFGVRQFRVPMSVFSTVLVTEEFCPKTAVRVFLFPEAGRLHEGSPMC